ncbi:MAG: DnaJ domain-containing protein [Deltaproteobacteria bacterium]|jgi:DnaJ-class molecular chaperone|nr:DnaJ domain-containing protein [Deltaproteobacteria bacterium]
MNVRAYRELNLKKGASEAEIKAAFRKLAKEHHPDTGRGGADDVAKFRSAYKAYRELLRETKINGQKEFFGAAKVSAPVSPTPFRYDGERKHGLDVYVELSLVRPYGSEFEIILPFTSHEACPRCLGQGQTLGRLNFESQIYRPQTCPKCQGQGAIGEIKYLTVKVTEQMAQRGKFRLRGAGGYLPSQAKRGDLIVSLRFVDTLPVGN